MPPYEGLTILGPNAALSNLGACYTEGIPANARRSMLTLYIRPGCPYSHKVLLEAEELGLTLALKNVNEPALEDELVARGGKLQLPYLVDEVYGVEMYESDDIIAHLHASFTPKP